MKIGCFHFNGFKETLFTFLFTLKVIFLAIIIVAVFIILVILKILTLGSLDIGETIYCIQGNVEKLLSL